MSDLQSLLASLPIDQLAAQTGESPDAVRQAADVVLPALLGGLQANADGGGAASLLEALGQHADRDAGAVDPSEGAQIASHIFGANQDQVISQLGSTGVSGGLVQKLIPLLAPIVMAWLAKQLGNKATAPAGGSAGTDILGQVLGQVLGGSTGGTSGGAGGLLGQVLGGLLGGGRR
jgi:hypothetical protein